MIIIPTIPAEFLAKKLARDKSIKIVLPFKKEGSRFFPDGEIFTKLKVLSTQKVVVLHSGSPRPNDGLVELEMTLGVLKNFKIKSIEVFFTYFPYCRQDKNTMGEINMAEAIIKKLINYYKASKIYILDPHFYNRPWIKNYPIQTVSAMDLLLSKAQKKFPEIIFLAPDEGSQDRIGLPGPVKKRSGIYNVNCYFNQTLSRLVKGKTIGVLDDMIETGGTLISFYNACKKAGAKDLVALATHGVVPEGLAKVRKIYKKVYLTNSIQVANGVVDISGLILNSIK
jgi:ribose-phosphate pyrophosphokinase